MRTEFVEYAFLSPEQRDAIVFPTLDASTSELAVFWNAINTTKMGRGEQPDEVALPLAGALRGDVPLSSTERSEA